MFNKFKSARLAAIAAAGYGLILEAHAALPAGVEAAVETAETDGTTLVGILAGAGVVVYLIAKLLRRFGIML